MREDQSQHPATNAMLSRAATAETELDLGRTRGCLLHLEGKSDGGVGEAALDAFEEIHFEGFADVVAGGVFDGVLDEQGVGTGIPWLRGNEAPAALVIRDLDLAVHGVR